MKMGFLFGNLFWGIIVILVGISIILKGYGVNIPYFHILIAIVIIMFGLSILIGGFSKKKSHGINTNSKRGKTEEFTSVFADGSHDFGKLDPKTEKVGVTVVFGNMRVKLPSDIGFDFESNAVFGTVVTSGKSNAGIASSDVVVNPDAKRRVKVEANAVFGKLEFTLDPNYMSLSDSSKTAEDSTSF